MHNQDTTPPDASGDARPHQPHREYEVGYGKPPKETQFKKGQSRNPKRRPRHVKTRGKLLSEVLDAKVSVIEDGRRRKIPNVEAMCKQVVNRAAQGDKKSTQAVLRMIKTFYRHGAKPDSKKASRTMNPAVRLILPNDGGPWPSDPELTRRLVRAARDWEIEQQQKRNPGNDKYDESVWKLKNA